MAQFIRTSNSRDGTHQSLIAAGHTPSFYVLLSGILDPSSNDQYVSSPVYLSSNHVRFACLPHFKWPHPLTSSQRDIFVKYPFSSLVIGTNYLIVISSFEGLKDGTVWLLPNAFVFNLNIFCCNVPVELSFDPYMRILAWERNRIPLSSNLSRSLCGTTLQQTVRL